MTDESHLEPDDGDQAESLPPPCPPPLPSPPPPPSSPPLPEVSEPPQLPMNGMVAAASVFLWLWGPHDA